VLLSHAHIDHSGNLPLLVKNGFRGPIYTSAATADLCRPMLADAASLQEKDAEFLNKRNRRRKSLNLPGIPTDRVVEPLYTIPGRRGHLPALSAGRPAHSHPSAPAWSISPLKPATYWDPPACCWSWNPDGPTKARLGFTGDLRAARAAHHPRPRAAASSRLPDYGKHLRRPRA
jgi:hypothetical protein